MGPFLTKLVERTKNMKIGNPNDEDTKVGATISEEQAQKVMSYIDVAKKEVTKHRILNNRNMTGATSGAETAYPSRAPEFIPGL